MGMAPSSLTVLPVNRVNTGNQPDANIMNNVTLVNIMPFGMCLSRANPACRCHCGGVGANSSRRRDDNVATRLPKVSFQVVIRPDGCQLF
jgi:hypothetical protein